MEGEERIPTECVRKDPGQEETQTQAGKRQRALPLERKVKNGFLLTVCFVLTSKGPWIALRRCLNEVM